MSAPSTPGAQVVLDRWTLVRPDASPCPGVRGFSVVDPAGRQGVMRVMERSVAGPDGGRGLIDLFSRLERVVDTRVVRPLGSGFATLDGQEVVFGVNPVVEGTPLGRLTTAHGSALMALEVLGLAVSAAEALSSVHAVGVAHGNLGLDCLVLRPGGTLALMDVGWCAWPKGAAAPARHFPAPELRAGGVATFAGDVFSLCLVMSGACVGMEALMSWLAVDPTVLPALVKGTLERQGGVPAEAVRALVTGLQPDPQGRPSAIALAGQIKPLAAALPQVPPEGQALVVTPVPKLESWLGESTDPARAQPLPASAPLPAPVPQPAPAPFPVPAPLPPASPVPAPGSVGGFGNPTTIADPEVLSAEPVTPAPEPAGPPPLPAPSLPPVSLPPVPAPPAALAPPKIQLPPPPQGPIVIHLETPAVGAQPPADLPIIGRWTERPAGRGATAVEWVKPQAKRVQAARSTSWMIWLAAAVGLGAGWLLGRTDGSSAQPVGALRIETNLADQAVEASLDGRHLEGQGPVWTVPSVVAGDHVVVLRVDGAEPAIIPVRVDEGRTAVVKDAPELYAGRLSVTASAKGVTVALGDGPARSVPAEFDDLEPGSDVELVFLVGKEVLRRRLKVPGGDVHFHLDVAGRGGGGGPPPPGGPAAPPAREEPSPAPPPQAAAGAPPPPPPPPPPARTTRSAPAATAADRVLPANATEAKAVGDRALIAGDFVLAEAAMRRALDLDPGQAEAMRSLAIAQTRLGRPCDGLTQYRRYLEARPDAQDAERVRGIVKELEQRGDCR